MIPTRRRTAGLPPPPPHRPPLLIRPTVNNRYYTQRSAAPVLSPRPRTPATPRFTMRRLPLLIVSRRVSFSVNCVCVCLIAYASLAVIDFCYCIILIWGLFAAGIGIRVAIKPEYRITPPVYLFLLV